MNNKFFIIVLFTILFPISAYSMHIAEGFLPVSWSLIWYIAFIPFLILGYISLKKQVYNNLNLKILYAAIGGFVFVLSSLKLPSVAGSSSHLTGIAIGAILFGASAMSVIGLIVLLFQALLLAHGGITTLGANSFSMAVVGAFVAVFVFQLLRKINVSLFISVFVAALLSDLSIYIFTSIQLALAFQGDGNTFMSNFIKFSSLFAITQVPLAIAEGILSVLFFKLILRYRFNEPFIEKVLSGKSLNI